MSLTSKYLTFIESLSETGKTKIVDICPKGGENVLGQIRWYGPWRRYCFFPSNDHLFDRNCLNDILDYIDKITEERKMRMI